MRRCIFLKVVNVLPSSQHKHTISNGGNMRPEGCSSIIKPLEVDTNAETYRRLARELALLSADEFGRRLYRFSRTNFDFSQTAAVHAHVSELLCRRIHEVSMKCVRGYAHLAHVAKLHDLCLEVYYARAGFTFTDAAAADKVVNSTGGLAVFDAVVDSAYSLASTKDLVRLASFCVKHLQHVPSLGWEVMSAFSLVRTLWRCVCVALSRDGWQATEAKQAIEDAAYIYDNYMTLVYPDSCRKLNTQDVLCAVQRFVKYASSGDEGEMLFFRFCLEKGFLQRPRDMAKKTAANNTLGPSICGDDEIGSVSEEQWFYASLIATCRVGHHVESALRYFDDIGSFLGVIQVGSDDILRPRARKIQQHLGADGSAETISKSKKSMEDISEFLILQLLNVLQTAKENEKIVFSARAMLCSGAQLGISVWSIVLIAAGELRAVDLALAAFTQAKDALTNSSGGVDRRGNEYLLQTAIHALSKCQVPRFEEDYLRLCQEEQLMHCTSEFYFCALLQHVHNSTDPAAGTEEVLLKMKKTGTPLTTRLVSRLLKIYLRVESDKLLDLYKHATQALGLFKSSWIDELLLWADRRRYDITSEERKFILDEVERLHGTKGLHSVDLGGLRTQYALLRYDYEHTPREVFFRTSNPPETEPTILDSRAHFLIKKPYCIAHDATEHRGFGAFASCFVIGDPDKKQRFFRCALLATEIATIAKGDVREDEFRAYMGTMLESLQQNNNGVI